MYLAGLSLPFHWSRTLRFYLIWLYRLAYLVFLYHYWTRPFEINAWIYGIGLRAGIVRDSVFRGPFWDSLGLGAPQPREGWKFLPPNYMIWQDEIVYMINGGWEESEGEV